MVEKIVQRVPVSMADDDQAFFDMLTFELGYGSDDRSLSKRLAELAATGRLDAQVADVLADAVQRLRAVDALLQAHGL